MPHAAIEDSWRNPVLINTIGHSAGVLLFGVIIALLLRDWHTHRTRQIRLPLIAALLAFGWNLGSLSILASHALDSRLIDMMAAANFSMLTLIPAVLLQVLAQGRKRVLVAAGYLVSGCAVALHVSELFSSQIALHQAGLIVIVVGFGGITIAALVLERRRGSNAQQRSEWISLGCLLLFTTSFLHFGYQHVSSPWTAEIAWHHVGIPVVLIVLLQDYRFLLLDTFTRFVVNSVLAAVYIAAILLLNFKLHLWDAIRPSMFLTGVALVVLCLSVILFTYLRNALQGWVSRVVFRRQRIEDSENAIVKLGSAAASESELLERAAQIAAEHLRTDRSAIVSEVSDRQMHARPTVLFHGREFHAEVRIPLRFSSGDARWLTLGARRGGGRYWSEDLEDMRRLGAAIIEQVERFRAAEFKRLVSQAELRALQAQINPHFLFNALNTLYGTIDRGSQDARRMVLNLAEIFRYFLQGHRTVIPLSEELRIVKAYLDIEALRLGDRLETELIVSESVEARLIPILSIQPLVENAVKHGIATKQGRGRVCVKAESVPAGLRLSVADTGVGFERSRAQSSGTGLGLENVRRRLTLCYGPTADLQIQSSSEGTTVSFVIPAATYAAERPTAAHAHESPAHISEITVRG